MKLAITPGHHTLTPGQVVLELTVLRQTSDRAAVSVPVLTHSGPLTG